MPRRTRPSLRRNVAVATGLALLITPLVPLSAGAATTEESAPVETETETAAADEVETDAAEKSDDAK